MKRFALFLIAPTVLLAGCHSGVKESLGLQRTAPDEFAVVERAPLVVPPNFNLVPPQPGAPRPQESHTAETAKGLMLGSQLSAPKGTAKPTGSAAEQSLLKKAGATQVDPNIRNKLNNPAPEEPKTAAEKMGLFSSDKDPNKALDPVEEAKKLKQQNVKTVPVTTQPNAANAK